MLPHFHRARIERGTAPAIHIPFMLSWGLEVRPCVLGGGLRLCHCGSAAILGCSLTAAPRPPALVPRCSLARELPALMLRVAWRDAGCIGMACLRCRRAASSALPNGSHTGGHILCATGTSVHGLHFV